MDPSLSFVLHTMLAAKFLTVPNLPHIHVLFKCVHEEKEREEEEHTKAEGEGHNNGILRNIDN